VTGPEMIVTRIIKSALKLFFYLYGDMTTTEIDEVHDNTAVYTPYKIDVYL
jgi:hypothetical protein